MKKNYLLAALLVLASMVSYAQTGVIAGGGNTATPCPGQANVLVYSYSHAQSGSDNNAYGYSFTTTAGAASVVSNYYAYLAPSTGNSLTAVPANAFLLGSVQNTGPGTQTIPTWNNSSNYYIFSSGTTYYIYITANILNTAAPGSAITVSTPTTSNFSWSSGETAGANTATSGTTTVSTGGTCATHTYFSYNGAPTVDGTVQTYNVPAGVSQIGITVAGAVGGTGGYSSGKSYGGMGGVTTATVTVTPSSTLYIYVGNVGYSCRYTGSAPSGIGGSNSGGGAQGGNGSQYEGGGGGGSSDVRTTSGSSVTALQSRFIMGGGGGGGAQPFVTTINQNTGGIGGNGSGAGGGQGIYNGTWTLDGCGAPGTFSCCAATGGSSSGLPGTNGALGAGGNDYPSYDGGGGGGGYYGAGGGGAAGASGGSSYVQNVTGVTVGTPVYNDGNNVGSGYVIITQLCINPPSNSISATSICPAGTSTLSNTTPGGTWSSSSSSIASVSSTGIVTGGTTAGTATISYTVTGGCYASNVITVSPQPTVTTITNNAPFCSNAGNALILTSTGPTNVASYSWNGPATSGITTPADTIPNAPDGGSGIYSLTVTSSIGCTKTYTTSVTINLGPTAMTGPVNLCPGISAVLSNTIPGGTWSSTSGGVATINASTGAIAPSSAGTTTVSYLLSSGCAVSRVETVNATPALSITPSSSATVCLNSGAPFTAVSAGSTFTWSGGLSTDFSCTACTTSTITPSVTGNTTYTVTATSAAGCHVQTNVVVSVNPVPAPISGLTNLCVGTTATLSSSAGGTWSSSDVSKATIGSTTGIITGIATGTTNLSYTYPTGCMATVVSNVAPAPVGIGGTPNVCVGLSTLLTHAIAGGTWASSAPATAAVSISGNVTGLAAGNATITYTLPSGCTTTLPVVVNPAPSAISGASSVCQGATTTLSDASGSGTWATSSSIVAPVNAFGVVTGSSTGNALITFTLSTGCKATMPVTVNITPGAIAGTPNVCFAGQTSLSDATGGGAWTSSNNAVASVNAAGGVTGIAAGNAIITYALGTGCNAIQSVTVNALPAALTGVLEVCQGASTSLSSTDAGGTWASSFAAAATVDASGNVFGAGAGNATITYTLGTGCKRTAQVTIDPLPNNISGTASVCQNASTSLFDFTSGGSWSLASGPASVDGTGVVTGLGAGFASVVYTLPTGCSRAVTVTVNALPAAIDGISTVCSGSAISLSDGTGGGTWSSNNISIVSVDAAGNATGVNAGTVNVTYTLTTGCAANGTVTVNPLPANITGTAAVCEGATSALHSTTTGGTWDTENPGLAVVSGTGVVTGISQGYSMITYTLPTGCLRTRQMTINPAPSTIGGNLGVCTGLTSLLSNSVSGGAWISGSAGIASVDASGNVTAFVPGVANITYTLPQGCAAMAQVTVNSLPSGITGNALVCQGSATSLSSATAGGNWSNTGSGNTSVSGTGGVTGLAAGVEAITYMLPTGCIATKNVTVNPLPQPISGNLFSCSGSPSALADATAGGAWSSSASATASVTTAGVVTGHTTGIANISYTLPTGCSVSGAFAVSPLPAAITGSASVCPLATTTLNDVTTGGNWSTSDITASVDASGNVTGITTGTVTITYALSSGCMMTKTMMVNPAPAAINGGSSVCQGTSLGLSDPTTGGTWSSSAAGLATINSAGLVIGLNAGNTIITYTASTGCFTTLAFAVNPAPGAISGNVSICPGMVSTLSNSSPGGVWGTPSPNANITLAGNVTGVAAGTATVSYLLPTGCVRTRIVTINPLPSDISGTASVCPGSSATLSEDAAGGTWSSHQGLIATVDGTGMVTGVAEGSTTITFTLPTGCYATKAAIVNPSVAPISGSMEICNGTTTTLSTASTGGTWMSDNTSIATIGGISGIVSGVNAGATYVTYVLPTGCMATTIVNIDQAPSVILGVSNLCIGGSSSLTNAETGGSWVSNSSGVAAIDASSGIVNAITAGTAMITYTLPTGCSSSSLFVVNPAPVTNTLTGGGTICAGAAGPGISTDGSMPAATYQLYRGTTMVASATGTGGPVSFGSFNTAGVYTLMATTAAGCAGNMPGSATVNVLPHVTPGVTVLSGAGTSLCSGNAATFTATATNGGTAPTYIWSVNGVAMGATSSYTYTPGDGDVVSATLTSNAACPSPATASDAVTMSVMPTLTPAANIAAAPGNTVCQGTPVTLTATAVNGGTAPQYSWYVNTAHMADGPIYNYTPTQGDVIMAVLLSNYGCVTANNVPSNTVSMTVNQVYVPVVSIVATPGTLVTRNQTVTFSTVVTGQGPSPRYQWLIAGVQIPGATNSTFVAGNFKDGDSVTVDVWGSGECGLKTINSVVMRINDAPSSVSSAAAGNSDIRLVPNPNNGTFSIAGTTGSVNDEDIAAEVTDMLGQVVYKNTITAHGGTVNEKIQIGNNLANGMYLLNLRSGSMQQVISFIVKQ